MTDLCGGVVADTATTRSSLFHHVTIAAHIAGLVVWHTAAAPLGFGVDNVPATARGGVSGSSFHLVTAAHMCAVVISLSAAAPGIIPAKPTARRTRPGVGWSRKDFV